MPVKCHQHGANFTEECQFCQMDGRSKSDGGPSSYYDFQPGWKTWNDFMESKALSQWGAYSLHMKDVGKALCRFGAKAGTDDEYDMNKIVYSGLRMKEMKRKGSAREYLLRLLDDPQFQ